MFTIENGNRYLAQWDTGQRLIIDDREITEVHFAKGTNVAAVMQVTTEGDRRVVKVPNICLQLPNDLAVFFVVTTPDGRSNTVHFSTIRVVRRPRPDDYVETEDEVLRWTTLASTIGSLTDLQTVEKTNLVAAINEVLKKVDTGGSIDPAAIAQAVKDYLSENPVQEKDPTVPAWAKETEKPSYTAQEVGADPSGTAAGLVAAHNTAEAAHNDIRLLIQGLTDRLNALADSDDTTLDQLSEVVAYIKANRELIASITTDKVSVTDIVNDLVTNVTNKPLSAAQGVALKTLIDAISIPEKLPNPNALTFTGAATGSYDGSKPLTVNVPSLAVDDSLTQEGQAADAAAVREELNSLSSKIAQKVANVYIGDTQPTDGTLYWLDTSDSGGSGDKEETVAYAVTADLTNVTIDNTAESVTEGARFAAALTADDGYALFSVSITMGGEDITASSYSNGNIYIASVTGDIVITAVAVEVSEEVTVYTITNNLANATSNNSVVSVEENSEYTATLTAATDYRIETVTVTMGGVDVTSYVYADGVITIPAVTGDVVITVTTISAPVSAVFELETPMTFDSSEEYQIDYCLTDKDKDWSAVIDFTATASGTSYIFRSGNTTNNSLGIRAQASYFWFAQIQFYDSKEIGNGTVTNKKVVFTHVNGSNELNLYYVDTSGSKVAYTFTRENYVSDLCGTSSVTVLGKHSCTIDEFKCYERVISESEINTFLGVE